MRAVAAADTIEPERRTRRRAAAVHEEIACDENGLAYVLRPAKGRDRAALNHLRATAETGGGQHSYFGIAGPGEPTGTAPWPAAGVTVVAERGGALIGAARFERVLGSTDARVAVATTSIPCQREIGSRLVASLARAARDAGVEHFVATLASKNASLLAVFAGAGFATEIGVGDGIMHARFNVEPVGPEAGRSSVRAIPLWRAVDGHVELADAISAV